MVKSRHVLHDRVGLIDHGVGHGSFQRVIDFAVLLGAADQRREIRGVGSAERVMQAHDARRRA